MIHPKKNPLFFWTMHFYVKWIVGRHFHGLLYDPIEINKNKSILLIANHYSFWDSLILYCINNSFIKKKMHIMILEETAREHIFFKYGGTFTVRKKSKDIIASLDYAAGLLEDPKNLVLIFPQGRLYSNFTDHITFEKGISRIINKAEGKFSLLFATAFVQYFKHLKPSATVYFKTEEVNYAGKSIAELQNAYQQFYNASKLLQTQIDIEQ